MNGNAKPQRLIFFIGNDFLAKYLVWKWRLSPIQAGLYALVWSWLISLVYALASNTLLPSSTFVALSEDSGYILSETVIHLLVWGYFVWIVSAPAEVLQRLEDTDIITLNDEQLADACKTLRDRKLVILPALLGIFVSIFYVTSLRTAPAQWLNQSIAFLTTRTLLVVFPTVFAGGLIIYRVFINAMIFRVIFEKVDLHPLHPDRAGGLHALGRYAVSTTYLIGIAGCLGAGLEYGAYLEGFLATAYFAHTTMIGYVLLAPLSFFAPLSAAHKAMQRAKDKLVLQIAEQFNLEFRTVSDNLSSSGNELKESVEKVQQLRILYDIAQTFPVWPFDVGTIRRFIITISSPILTIAISIIIELIKDKLKN
jgi:hypothetical protein